MFDLTTVTAEQFSELQEQEFVVTSTEAPVTLKLIEVTKLGAGERDGGAFSLLWQGPLSPILTQEIHRLSHPKTGDQDVFLVPVAQKEAGFQYEAVFT
ncbi:DUF6916 family protein [Pseudophaeobacter arcticus]|uniref:DUF6916 family protein n=1 Tax=Pseudophaeobacter arcticus TaxID=385492 RepID=UPI003A977449